MSSNRGTEVGYPEVQNMLERLRRQLAALQNRVDAGPGGGGDGGDEPPGTIPGISPCSVLAIGYEETGSINTGLTHIYGVRALNEYAYVAGMHGTDPTLQSYRIKADGNFVLLNSLILSQQIQRFILHGSFLFGCRDGADGQNLISVDIGTPWNLAEKDQLDVGFAAYGLDAQGCYCYVVGGTNDVAVVDVSDPSVLRKVN